MRNIRFGGDYYAQGNKLTVTKTGYSWNKTGSIEIAGLGL